MIKENNSNVLWNKGYLAGSEIAAKLDHVDDFEAYSVSIDSRTIAKKSLFIAIKGKFFDGNEFAIEALSKGAEIAIVSKEIPLLKGYEERYRDRLIYVDDTLQAMIEMARYSASRSKAIRIGITGSTGKTTTKFMLKAVMEEKYRVFVAPASFNNIYGVPLSLVNMPIDTEYGIFELGTDHKGEIAELADIALPDHVIITNICNSHFSNFKSERAIAEEKSSIMKNMQSPEMTAVLGTDHSEIDFLVERVLSRGLSLVTCGRKESRACGKESQNAVSTSAHISISSVSISGNKSNISLSMQGKGDKTEEMSYEIGSLSDAMVQNSLYVCSMLYGLGIGVGDIRSMMARLGKFQEMVGRGKVSHISSRKITVIDESYNAIEWAMEKAIERAFFYKNRILDAKDVLLVFGDMVDDDGCEEELYGKLREKIISSNVRKFISVGRNMKEFVFDHLPDDVKIASFTESKELSEKVHELVSAGDVVLIKGANRMRLNLVVDSLISPE